jgi:hypothetical protein
VAPAFGLVAADFDGDGLEDLFLSQNFFATEIETPRCAAGQGLILLGDGHGGFRSLTSRESGIAIDGDQRGTAAADFDGDGCLDLAVGQNRGPTKLFHNAAAKPGLRIRLQGPEWNPFSAGAAVRLRDGDRYGPIHEVCVGSGYWSQDSATLVLSSAPSTTHLWIRWPGGRTNEFALPQNSREVLVDPAQGLRVLR